MVDQNAMVNALLVAGVKPAHATEVASSMYSVRSSFIEVYGKSIRDQLLVTRRNLNIDGLNALDLRTLKPNGEPWDFTKRADRKEARTMIDEQDPDWILGAPPCTSFSIWNYAINYAKMDADVVRAKLAEGRLHLNFVCSLYRRQVARGKYFLHEQRATALSWNQDAITASERNPFTQVVTCDQCRYGLVTPSAEDSSVMLPAMKPTICMTNSYSMA